MTEDVELTRKILNVYAEEEEFPSSIDANSICLKFQQEYGRDKVMAHLVWAKDAGLLLGPVYSITEFAMGPQYDPRRVHGLSKAGSDYIAYANSGLWDKAKKYAKDKSIPATTQVLAKILPKLAEQSMI